jgi:hypothetical protein
MATLNIPTVELVSTLRAAPANGPTNSADYNDSWTESLADLASLSGFINDILLPMLNGLISTIQPSSLVVPHGLEGRYIFSDTSDLTQVFYDNLSNQSLSIADSLRILNGIIGAVETTVANLNVEVTALQTQLSSTNQNDIAQTLQNFAAALSNLSNQVSNNTITINELPILLQTNSTNNSVQNKLNLVAGTNITLAESFGTVTISSTTGGGSVIDVPLAPGASGPFSVAHGGATTPIAVAMEMTSGGSIYFQPTGWDATHLYLIASGTTVTGNAQCFFSAIDVATPGGTSGQIQYNNGGVFGGVTLVPVSNGGTGTATPSLIAGSFITITGTWPNQTVAVVPGFSGFITGTINTGQVAIGNGLDSLAGDAYFTASSGTVYIDASRGASTGSFQVGQSNTNLFQVTIDAFSDVSASFFSGPGQINIDPGFITFTGIFSGSAALGCALDAGVPNQINLPTTTGLPGQVLVTDGGNPQQTQWVSKKYSVNFTSITTMTILGVTHGLTNADLMVAIYDSGVGLRTLIIPDSITIDSSTFDVTINFTTPQTGRAVIQG